MPNQDLLILLNRLFCYAPGRMREAIRKFKTIPEFRDGFREFGEEIKLSPEKLTELIAQLNAFNLDKTRELLDKNQIKLLSFSSSDYPELLTHISDPPQLLFYKGNLEFLSELCMAVVGPRKPT